MGLGCRDNIFWKSGPTHLMVNTGRGSSQMKMVEVDWDNPNHRRCITACLVKATYVLEDEYQTEAMMQLAPAWWESFHFRRLDYDRFARDCKCGFCKIFVPNPHIRFSRGVVFKYEPPDGARRQPSAPHYIVAFRGTMPWHFTTMLSDMRLNLRILLNKRHLCSRCSEADERIGELVKSTGDSTGSAVWLTGHSLGASIALEVGRKMMMNKGFNLPTFVYNPPHVSFIRPAAKILHVPEKAKRVVHHGSNLAEYTMGKTIPSSQRKHMVAVFQKLSPWVPELYVHEKDVICNGFIENFELRKKVQERLPMITKSAETLAYRDLLHGSAVFGLDNKRERLHLLPSARLWKKKKSPGEEEDPHGLKQWWKPDIEAERMSSKLYSGHECWPELC
ncbi:hypothetical protein QOZ80_7AG0569790 [Eleusine coracana subsp. coracana]|nr:hypothetical protein QOZ80_7AG0569790 [Eleusine coracana subsp. coracana]